MPPLLPLLALLAATEGFFLGGSTGRHKGGVDTILCTTTAKVLTSTVYDTVLEESCSPAPSCTHCTTVEDSKCETQYETAYQSGCTSRREQECSTVYDTIYTEHCTQHYVRSPHPSSTLPGSVVVDKVVVDMVVAMVVVPMVVMVAMVVAMVLVVVAMVVVVVVGMVVVLETEVVVELGILEEVEVATGVVEVVIVLLVGVVMVVEVEELEVMGQVEGLVATVLVTSEEGIGGWGRRRRRGRKKAETVNMDGVP